MISAFTLPHLGQVIIDKVTASTHAWVDTRRAKSQPRRCLAARSSDFWSCVILAVVRSKPTPA
jgi:hypothetical protein